MESHIYYENIIYDLEESNPLQDLRRNDFKSAMARMICEAYMLKHTIKQTKENI